MAAGEDEGRQADWREDAQRVRAVRGEIGDDVTLMCDANQRWDLSTANRIMPVLEEARWTGWKKPLHADDLESPGACSTRPASTSPQAKASTPTISSPASLPRMRCAWSRSMRPAWAG